ncbi:hypothetical protein PTKIN_Ptkin09bG0143600 [Pterospermum kingtungense]
MHFQQSLLVRLLMVLILLPSLLVSGEGSLLVDSMNGNSPGPGVNEKQSVKEQLQQQHHHQRLRHSFDALFSSKREVPNASDPLHNR